MVLSHLQPVATETSCQNSLFLPGLGKESTTDPWQFLLRRDGSPVTDFYKSSYDGFTVLGTRKYNSAMYIGKKEMRSCGEAKEANKEESEKIKIKKISIM